MKILLIILILGLAAPVLAQDPAAAPSVIREVRPAVSPKASQIKKLPETASPYIDVCQTPTTAEGEWLYTIQIRNRGSVPVPANTLEAVVFRKTGEEWLLVDTKTISEELPTAGRAAVATGIFPRCCSTFKMMAKLRVRGTQTILDTKEFSTTTLKLVRLSDSVIDKNNQNFTVAVENRSSKDNFPILLKAFSIRGEKKTLLSEKKIIAPPGKKSFSGSCKGIRNRDYLQIEAYAPTTCVESEDACFLSLTGQRY